MKAKSKYAHVASKSELQHIAEKLKDNPTFQKLGLDGLKVSRKRYASVAEMLRDTMPKRKAEVMIKRINALREKDWKRMELAKWEISLDPESQYWIGVCEVDQVTLQGETIIELAESIQDVRNFYALPLL